MMRKHLLPNQLFGLWRRPVIPVAAPNLVARSFIVRMHQTAAPWLAQRTVCIYGVDYWGHPTILGSGVAISAGGERFVITAAHVLDLELERRGGIYLSPGIQGGQLVDLDGAATHRTQMPASGSRHDDHVDIALICLTPRIIKEFGTEVEFLNGDHIDPSDTGERGSYYFLCGFPRKDMRINKQLRSVRARSINYGTTTYHNQRGVWPGMDDLHIDLDFAPDQNVDDNGNAVKLPTPEGISGCGIWRLHRAGDAADTWTRDRVRLVAIEHRVHRKMHVVRGTNFRYMNQIIARHYPVAAAELYDTWRRQQQS